MKRRAWPIFTGLILLITACSSSDSGPSDQRADAQVVGSDALPGADAAANGSDGALDNQTRDCGGCPGRQICNGETGLCEEPPGCQENEDCFDTRVCVNGRCQDACGVSGCPGQQICGENGLCLEPDRCESDDACLDNRICVNETCLDRCTEDATCPGMQSCEVTTGRCQASEICIDALDCDPGQVCADGTCSPGCDENRPCNGQQTCVEGICLEPEQCADNSDCLRDRLCVEQTCLDACQEDADCPGQRRCDRETGLCPEPEVCADDNECDQGRICLANRCSDACVQGECPGGQECVNARCQEPDLCIGDLDCIADRICERGRCSDPCQDDSDCLGSDVCAPNMGRCVEFQPECIIDDDCPANAACIIGTCREGRCMSHANCPAGEDCIDGGCAPALRPDCRNDDDCDDGQRCADFGRCVDAGPCREQADCNGLNSICFDTRCVACRVDADCQRSEICHGGRCESQGVCNQDDDCPGVESACENNRCIAAPCQGDEFDLRLGRPQLDARLYTNLVLCDGDADLYRFEIGPGEGAMVHVRHQEDAGDLLLNVRALGEDAWGQSIAGVARAGILPKPVPRMLEVSITGRAGYRTPYWLDLRRTTPEDCVPDDYEPALGNNLQETAQPLEINPNSAVSRLCRNDRDWFRFIAPGGTSVTAVITSDQLAGLNATLVNSVGGLAGDVVNDGRDKRITVSPQRRTEYGLELSLAPGVVTATNFIRLDVESNGDAEARACADAPRINVGDVVWFDNQLGVDRISNQCGGPSLFNDRVARFTIVQDAQYLIRTMQADRSTTIALRSDCADPQSEQTCGGNGEVGPVPLTPGDYWVIVDSPLAVPLGLLVERVD
ncbi:MAG: hypothetical protein VYA30_01785 [Myxococcota bacterium]|nr:hypothetical protein [Myxococcota bacterium]